MKKIIYLVYAFICFSFLESCSPKIVFNSKVPYYTTVDNLLKLKAGMTMSAVRNALGIDPHDVLTIQNEGGSSIFVYNYRLLDKKLTRPAGDFLNNDYEHLEMFQKEGVPWYNGEEKKAYVYFKDGKYKSMITEDGVNMSEFIMLLDNNLRILSSEDLKKLRVTKVGNNYITNDSTYIINIDAEVKKNMNTFTPVKKKGNAGAVVLTLLLTYALIGAIYLAVN